MITPLLKGLAKTFEGFLKKPVTLQYPEERLEIYPRFRGRVQLVKDENGKPKCVACFLCRTVCPSKAIHIEAAEDERHNKYPEIFEVDLLRCIFCGFCQEACPREAIVLNDKFELADYTRQSLKLSKEKLLEY
ncbi:MAG: NADH-quinone oxidoreductase subunit I [Thermodesulfobacteriota bacterium]|nr:NADH-quinone oxidoreductase subunit I [Thermodesulfobacteriota bacterium]